MIPNGKNHLTIPVQCVVVDPRHRKNLISHTPAKSYQNSSTTFRVISEQTDRQTDIHTQTSLANVIITIQPNLS